MSVASEITRINNNIANAYTACNNKGATLPQTQNSNNLANCINSISGLPRGADSNGVYGYPTNNFTFSTPSDATSLSVGVLNSVFKGCTTLIAVDLSSLTEVTGTSTMESFCEDCTALNSIDLSNITTINGSNVMSKAFSNTSITSVDLSSLTTISSSSAMNSAFLNCPLINSIDLSSLTSLVGSGAMMPNAFALSTNPTSPLPLTSVTFTSLSSIGGTAPMRNIFAKRDGLEIYFPALNSNSFTGQLTTYLDNLVNGAVGCTVHFPSNMQSVIGNWSSVQNGFGGTNTTVLWDLPATT